MLIFLIIESLGQVGIIGNNETKYNQQSNILKLNLNTKENTSLAQRKEEKKMQQPTKIKLRRKTVNGLLVKEIVD